MSAENRANRKASSIPTTEELKKYRLGEKIVSRLREFAEDLEKGDLSKYKITQVRKRVRTR